MGLTSMTPLQSAWRIIRQVATIDRVPVIVSDMSPVGEGKRKHYDWDEHKEITYDEVQGRQVAVALDRANLISSYVLNKSEGADGVIKKENNSRRPNTENLHAPVLDIDLPVAVVQSTTPGHFHLYIDKEMPWPDYQKLLIVMAEVGILETGYVEASLARKASFVRLPWVPKKKYEYKKGTWKEEYAENVDSERPF